MIFRIILLFFCTVGIFSTQAHAQVFLEQAKVSLAVAGGEHINGSFLIHNTSAAPIVIRAYWEDFEYKPPYDGTKNFLPAGTAPSSASQWVVFSPQSFTLPPYGQQAINYTVSAPSQVQEGHYGVLFFERTTTGSFNNETVSLVSRIGCLFFIEPANKNKNAVVQDVGLKNNAVTADFTNQGNIILLAHTTYYMMQDGGLVALRGDAGKLFVPPGKTAPFKISFKKELSAGKYTLVVNVDLGEGDVVVKEIGLTVDAGGQMTIVNSQD